MTATECNNSSELIANYQLLHTERESCTGSRERQSEREEDYFLAAKTDSAKERETVSAAETDRAKEWETVLAAKIDRMTEW